MYFDSATSALMLGTLGRYLEASARAGAGQRLGASLGGGPARVRRLAGGAAGEVGAAEVLPGDLLEIGVDQAAPVDAVVAPGAEGEVELSVLTGQSRPRAVRAGEPVPAGAVVLGRPLRCVAARRARESTLERLAALARSLREERPAVARWADRFAAWLLPAVGGVALGALAYWTARSGLERGVGWRWRWRWRPAPAPTGWRCRSPSGWRCGGRWRRGCWSGAPPRWRRSRG